MKQKLKQLHKKIDHKLIAIFSKKPILSSIYYLLFSRKFYREHYSVLQGRIQYQEKLNKKGSSSVLLRRNTHRLEKGLIMRPRREVFAADYIMETVKCYHSYIQSKSAKPDELKWSHDVLNEYFSVVNIEHPTIKKALNIFKTASEFETDDQASIPYARKDLVRTAVSFDELKSLCVQRRSIRWYKDQSVDKELIYKAAEIATLAPSACNRQPFSFHTILDKDIAVSTAKVAMGTAGFSDNIPALIAVVGDLSAYPFEQDRHVIYIDGSLAAMQMMLALETIGLSSCPINWPDIEFFEKKMAKRLNLNSTERPILLIAVGYADDTGMIPYSQKKSPKEIVKII